MSPPRKSSASVVAVGSSGIFKPPVAAAGKPTGGKGWENREKRNLLFMLFSTDATDAGVG